MVPGSDYSVETKAESDAYFVQLVTELRKLPRESEWFEFKMNNASPDEIGEYISALGNSATLLGKPHAYVVWGVQDSDHKVVGTSFNPSTKLVGAEELEHWLHKLLSPGAGFHFYSFDYEGLPLSILVIEPAYKNPIQWKGNEYIRIGSYRKKLKDSPDKARALWAHLNSNSFEEGVALADVDDARVLDVIDYSAYCDLLKIPLPEARSGILELLQAERVIIRSEIGRWHVSNMGALLFAKDLGAFAQLWRKAPRLIQYKGNSRVETVREQVFTRGYAVSFESLISGISALLPSNEAIGEALRVAIPLYPELALRETVANALIHQDFVPRGTGPMIEIFADRLEVTNPGMPLVQAQRLIDLPPRSRNEGIAGLMRRIGICEERGTGWDKIVFQAEIYQLPAPLVEELASDAMGSTRTVLFAPRPLTRMESGDRIRAVYQHACLRHVNRDTTTNTSIRQRFGIEQRNSATASRLIRETIEAGMIVPYDPHAAAKLMRYVPYWAATPTGT